MYVILGATGNIGSVIANQLLAKGEKIRVIGRNPEKLRLLAAKGAETISADVHYADALATALSGARAAFLMIPPAMTSPDYRQDQERIGDAIATAVEKSKIRYAVGLSSFGAQVASGTGPIAGLHDFEQKLNHIPGLNVLHLRPAYFMENHLMAVPMIQNTGVFAGALEPELMVATIATRDIGEYAGERLLKLDFAGRQTQELLGERDLSMNTVTAIIGRALHNPQLHYLQLPYAHIAQGLSGMGVSAKTAEQFVEMYRAINERVVVPEHARSASNTTATSFETFVQEVFVPAFQRGKAAGA
jgi:uncharacterized protein YbjT (DUF2867 family)